MPAQAGIQRFNTALTLGAVRITAEHYAALESAIRLSFTVAAILCLPGLYFSLIRGKMRPAD